MISKIENLDLSKQYTYGDYLTWRFSEMVELIRGKIVKMSPAPGLIHQKASSNLHIIIGSYLKNQPCQIFSAPFDVRLPLPPDMQSSDKVDTVVQPDISVICDPSKLDAKGCNGAPDWIIEILSPSTSKKDHTDKFEIYQLAGVSEYWLVYPDTQVITAYRLNNAGKYEAVRPNPFVSGETVPCQLFSSLELKVEEVFV